MGKGRQKRGSSARPACSIFCLLYFLLIPISSFIAFLNNVVEERTVPLFKCIFVFFFPLNFIYNVLFLYYMFMSIYFLMLLRREEDEIRLYDLFYPACLKCCIII